MARLSAADGTTRSAAAATTLTEEGKCGERGQTSGQRSLLNAATWASSVTLSETIIYSVPRWSENSSIMSRSCSRRSTSSTCVPSSVFQALANSRRSGNKMQIFAKSRLCAGTTYRTAKTTTSKPSTNYATFFLTSSQIQQTLRPAKILRSSHIPSPSTRSIPPTNGSTAASQTLRYGHPQFHS